jgi:preprotein translocase subunit SecE
MTADLNREQKRTLKKMGALDEQGNPARQARAPQARNERTTPAQYLREVREEMNKVAWPKWPEVRRYSIVVLLTVAVFTSIIGVTDTAVGFITDWLYKS